MQNALAIITGVMVAGSVYLMLSGNLVRFIFGLVLASNAVNLVIFAAGRPGPTSPPLIPENALAPAVPLANSLPQALILTAIVIGFSLLAFVFILFFRTFEKMGTVDPETLPEADAPQGDREPKERIRS